MEDTHELPTQPQPRPDRAQRLRRVPPHQAKEEVAAVNPTIGMSGTYPPHQMDGVASVRIKRGRG